MADNMDDYWSNEIKSYKRQLHTGPDYTHDLWKWREVVKLARIMRAETKCKMRMWDDNRSMEPSCRRGGQE